jgi:hypothetical protein
MLIKSKVLYSLAMAGLLLGGMSAYADYIPSTGPDQLLELDGNVDYDGNPNTGVDWANLSSGTGYFQSSLMRDNDALNTGNVGERYDANIWDKGSKDIQPISEWRWKNPNNHKATDKVDIVNATAAIFEKDGDMIVYLQADRYANDGSAYMGAWLFKNKITPIESGPDKGTFDGVHEDGDLLMLANFTHGGAQLDVVIYQWKDGALDETPIYGYGYAIANDGNTPASSPYDNYVAKTSNKVGDSVYPDLSFFEGGINLSKFYRDRQIPMPCFTTIMIESRNSASIDAALEDFALDNEFTTCDFSVAKTCVGSAINATGDGINYDYNITITNTGFGTLDVNWTDDHGTPNDGSDDTDGAVSVSNTSPTIINYQILNAPLGITNGVKASGQGLDKYAYADEPSECPIFIDQNITVTKQCRVTLDGDESAYTVVRVDFDGTVCNNGNTKVGNLSLNDTKEGELGYQIDLNQTELMPGYCASYSGKYYPNTPGITCATGNAHSDEITLYYDENLSGESNSTMPVSSGTCHLCDDNCAK